MLEFIITNYLIFIIIAVVLLLGLFGYMMDRKKYEQYHDEIAHEARTVDVLSTTTNVAPVAEPIQVAPATGNETQDPLTGNN